MVCDGCGEQSRRSTYIVEGALAGRWLCRECNGRRAGLKRLSLAVQYRFKVARLFPPEDPMTVPLLRLMIAADDVRRAPYWHSIIGKIRQAIWYQEPCPKQRLAKRIWNGRAAMLDALYFDEGLK